MRRMLASGITLVAMACFAPAAQSELITGRINLGLNPGEFFEPASGFTNGDSSHTNTVSFNDGVVQVDFTATAEAFDDAGDPAGLYTQNVATGVVELGASNNRRVDPGESIKFTFDNIVFTILGPGPGSQVVDPSSFDASLSSIRLAAFEIGDDTFTYSGVGAGGLTGDDTSNLTIQAPVAVGDTFTIEGDTGEFWVQFVSINATYGLVNVPEPASALTAALAALALARSPRRRAC